MEWNILERGGSFGVGIGRRWIHFGYVQKGRLVDRGSLFGQLLLHEINWKGDDRFATSHNKKPCE